MHIKELMERNVGSRDNTREGSANPLLQEAAREFFERRERAWRPGTVLLLSRALAVDPAAAASTASGGDAGHRPSAKQLQLAEIVEMMTTAQVRNPPPPLPPLNSATSEPLDLRTISGASYFYILKDYYPS